MFTLPGKIKVLNLPEQVEQNTEDIAASKAEITANKTDYETKLNQVNTDINLLQQRTADLETATQNIDGNGDGTEMFGNLDVGGKLTAGGDAKIGGKLIVNSIDSITDKDGNAIVKNESLDNFRTDILRDYMKYRYGGHILYGNDSEKIILSNLYPSVVGTGLCTDWTGCFNASQTQGNYGTVFKGEVIFTLPSVYADKEVTLASCFGHWSTKTATIEEAQHTFTFGSDMTIRANSAFWDSNLLTSVNVADGASVKVTNAQLMFYNCYNLAEVGALDLSGITIFSGMIGTFANCRALNHIHCKHFKFSFDISPSTQFETADLVEIISNLDMVTTPQTLTMGATNLAKLTQAQILVATGKGWTLA